MEDELEFGNVFDEVLEIIDNDEMTNNTFPSQTNNNTKPALNT